ncbi:uncharacterized protein BO97DRAFT_378376 [Aspergillus homomorphus CBS 101889]|uniref:Non-homologous end-joining factor 1 n=1 Tax=Aspergillus homomorphus (strain CBS 101889) TaxID=1450537 RepID=A0A395HKX1_ASPHC|nr:XLF-domain-containing protein [Aspergillus homomorphus CBS 101889]RAL07518.1 XLF-domain-containing protein [Aspergillus homomorphus CBS 101889]
MPLKWQRLRVSSSSLVPPLLYQFSYTVEGYELFITDLTYIWSEHLDRKSILRRADDDDTTIDPSEDQEQLTVLLQKIGEALQHDSGHNTVLSRGLESASLHLTTTTKLPAPLKPLRWNLYLSRNPHSLSTNQLLLPLIKAEAVWQSREQVLIDQLKKKDWVLGKLFDKLEAMGIDIGTVFPGVSGHRPGQKDTMLSHTAKYIKGVEPFDKDSWAQETNVSFPELSSAASLVTEATGFDVSSTDKLQDLSAPPEGWWEQLSAAVEDPSDSESQKRFVDKRPPSGSLETDTDSGNEDDDEDDEFERQETPPHLKRTTAEALSPSPGLKSNTETHETRSPTKSSEPSAVQKPAKGGLGIIGGRRKPQPKEKTPPPPVDTNENRKSKSPRRSPPEAADSDATASETDGDDDLSPPPPPKPKPKASAPAPAPAKRGLGVIGGKKEQQPPPPPPSSTPQASEQPSDHLSKSETKPPKRIGQLGVIGGIARSSRHAMEPGSPKDAAPSVISEQDNDALKGVDTKLELLRATRPVSHEPRSKMTPSTEPEIEETEQQRADRKREELKRQLEAKAKAPAKKKRKF